MTNDLARVDEGQLRQFNNELTRLEDEFAKALPAQMAASKFVRCITTAVQRDPKLLKCDRKSLWAAAMQAAHDGLYPDGRYGVILAYSTNVAKKGEKPIWVSLAQWQPMILGVYQKLHNSGKLHDIVAHVVYENDVFDFRQGDTESITHTSRNIFADRGKAIGVYAIAKTKNGGIYREAMSVADVERIRTFSKSPDSPAWRTHWDEMAKKSVVRRLAKRLPLSADDMSWFVGEEETETHTIDTVRVTSPGFAYEDRATLPIEITNQRGPDISWDDVKISADQRAAELNEEPPPPDLPSDIEPAS